MNPKLLFRTNKPKVLAKSEFALAYSFTRNLTISTNNLNNFGNDKSKNYLTSKRNFTENTTSVSNLKFDGNVFKNWPTNKLLRNWTVFKTFDFPILVKNAESLMNFFNKIPIIKHIFIGIMKRTYYGQFVGGSTEKEISQTSVELKQQQCEPMLAIPMETENITADIDIDKWHERNLEKIIDCIEQCKKIAMKHPAVMHIKITGLVHNETSLIISQFLTNQWNLEPEKFNNCVEEFYKIMKDKNYESQYLKDMLTTETAKFHLPGSNLPQDFDHYNHLKIVASRLDKMGQAVINNNIECLIDAEYVNINPVLAFMTMTMARKFNTQDRPYIWNTYQCYLKNTSNVVNFEIDYLKQFNKAWGGKMVRGAYLNKEQARAIEGGYENPTCDGIEKTHENYNTITSGLVDYMISSDQNIKFLLASHNEESIYKMLLKLESLDEKTTKKYINNIIFGQLYGMCDHISSELGELGAPVYKSLPIGEMDDVMPYLARRAVENASAVAGSQKERIMIANTLKERISGMYRK